MRLEVDDAQLRRLEKQLHHMAELSDAIARDAGFLVFALLMSAELRRHEDGRVRLSLELPARTVRALRAICRVVTGVDGNELDDRGLFELLVRTSLHPANGERAARVFAHTRRDGGGAAPHGERAPCDPRCDR